jgi:hypothetical protein
MDTILQNTVREMGKAMGSSRAFIQIGLGTAEGDRPQEGG